MRLVLLSVLALLPALAGAKCLPRPSWELTGFSLSVEPSDGRPGTEALLRYRSCELAEAGETALVESRLWVSSDGSLALRVDTRRESRLATLTLLGRSEGEWKAAARLGEFSQVRAFGRALEFDAVSFADWTRQGAAAPADLRLSPADASRWAAAKHRRNAL